MALARISVPVILNYDHNMISTSSKGVASVWRKCTLGSYPSLCYSLVIAVVGLVEEEICSQFFVLVTRKVGLNNEVTLEPQAAKAFNSLTLLLSDTDCLSTGWQRRVLIGVLGEQL